MDQLAAAFKETPLIAILRGVEPNEVVEMGEALLQAGISIAEVPLNSPDPMLSIKYLVNTYCGRLVVGAGTVLDERQAQQVTKVGAEFCVSPNTNVGVIKQAIYLGMTPIPGYQTPTEAFTAIDAGATWLKYFPAGALGPAGIKSLREVIPDEINILAVGGINISNIGDYLAAGCNGVAIAGALYKPGRTAAEVKAIAADLVATTKKYRS